jgi:hypothetical protein
MSDNWRALRQYLMPVSVHIEVLVWSAGIAATNLSAPGDIPLEMPDSQQCRFESPKNYWIFWNASAKLLRAKGSTKLFLAAFWQVIESRLPLFSAASRSAFICSSA